MKLFDSKLKTYYFGTTITHYDDKIRIYNHENEFIAAIPASQAKLIFNVSEIPFMEEVK